MPTFDQETEDIRAVEEKLAFFEKLPAERQTPKVILTAILAWGALQVYPLIKKITPEIDLMAVQTSAWSLFAIPLNRRTKLIENEAFNTSPRTAINAMSDFALDQALQSKSGILDYLINEYKVTKDVYTKPDFRKFMIGWYCAGMDSGLTVKWDRYVKKFPKKFKELFDEIDYISENNNKFFLILYDYIKKSADTKNSNEIERGVQALIKLYK